MPVDTSDQNSDPNLPIAPQAQAVDFSSRINSFTDTLAIGNEPPERFKVTWSGDAAVLDIFPQKRRNSPGARVDFS